MVEVHLTSALRDRVSGVQTLSLAGDSVAGVLAQLVERHPQLDGWILDEQSRIRQHVNVFVNQELAGLESPVAEGDELWVIPAISGGADPGDVADSEVEVLVGTKKGLFALRGSRGGSLEIVHREFAGQEVPYAMRDPRSGRYLASVVHGQFGPHLFWADQVEGEWHEADGPKFPPDTASSLERVWTVVPGENDGQLWAGVAPAALFESSDGGESWRLNRALWQVPGRDQWQGGLGGLALHSICPWPGAAARLTIGISAAGVWHSDDGGESWRRSGNGLVSRYLPDGAQEDASDQCVHNLHRSPSEPSTLYLQFHGGVYRSDDGGNTFVDIGTGGGLPADFGFPLVTDPRDADRAWVIPLNSDFDRVSAGAELRVFETRDRGQHWQARGEGLPAGRVYLTILRQAFCHDGADPLGLYFGATSGDLFVSADAGKTWSEAVRFLPPVLSVRCA